MKKLTRHSTNLIWLILTSTACVKMASYMSVPFLGIYLTKYQHVSFWAAGIIAGMLPLFALLGGLVGGYLTDKLGRIKIVKVSLLGSSISFVLWYVAANCPMNIFTLVVFGLVSGANGFFIYLFSPSSQSLLSDLLPAEKRHKYFQLRYTAINIGSIMGPLIGVTVGLMAHAILFLVTGIIYFLYFIIFTILIKKNHTQLPLFISNKYNILDSIKIIFMDSKLRYFIVSGVLTNICFAQLQTALSQYLNQLFSNGVTIYSYLLATNCAVFILLQTPIYYMTKSLSPLITIIYGLGILAISLLVFAFSQYHIMLFYCGMIIASIGELFIFPVSNSYIDIIAPDDLKGTYFGASMLRQLGLAIGPMLGGYLLYNCGGSMLFLMMAVIALIAAIVQFYGDRNNQESATYSLKKESECI